MFSTEPRRVPCPRPHNATNNTSCVFWSPFAENCNTNRAIGETLAKGWELLNEFPAADLKRIKREYIEKYYKKG